MPSVSAVALTKNSERTIEACLKALAPAVDIVVVVDTGSTDNTVQIAKDCGARVYHFEWRDDFAAARNFGDSLATTDWVVHVDSDEILRSEDTDKIREVCAKYKRTNVPALLIIQQINVMSHGDYVSHVGRMYKRGVFVWKGIIHEQPTTKRNEPFGNVYSDIGVIHEGYNSGMINIPEKCMRNIALLRKGIELEPNNADYHYFLGRESTIMEDYETAIQHLRIGVDLIQDPSTKLWTENAFKILLYCLETTKNYDGAQSIANIMSEKLATYSEGWYTIPTEGHTFNMVLM